MRGKSRTTGGERSAGWREVFAVGEFRALWAAELQSVAGDQLARVALTVLVYQHTASAGLAAATYAISLLPDLVAGPLLSGLADRFPRRTVMMVCDLARAVLVGLMLIPALGPGVLAGLLVAVQMFAAPFAAAQAATLPLALPGTRYVTGQAIRQVTVQVGQLAGFALGGTVVALIGTGHALAFDALTFLLSATLIWFGVTSRPAPSSPSPQADSHLGRLAAGARVIWASPRLRSLVGLAWLSGFAILPAGLAVPYAAEIGQGPATTGLLLAADPAGLIVGAIAIRWLAPVRQQRLMAPLAVMGSVPLLLFVTRPNTMFAVALLALSGVCGAYQIIASTTFMRLVPDAHRGQAFGLAGSGLIAVQGLGVLAGGALAQLIGSAAVVITLGGALGAAVGTTIAIGWHRQHRLGTITAA
jgi:predicted MFS family arabinose efflux permease